MAKMEKFLSCSPAISSLLGALALRRWLHFRLISRAWKQAIDDHIVALKHINVGELLGDNTHKCNDALQFFARTAPHLHCISFDPASIQPNSDINMITAIGNYQQLKALHLTGLKSSTVFEALGSLRDASKLEQLILPLPSTCSVECSQATLATLQACFQSLFAMQFLDLGSLDGLHPLLLDLPAPESLKELKVSRFTNHCRQLVPRCRSLEQLTVCSLPGGTLQGAVMQSLARMEQLKSLAVDFRRRSPSPASLQAVAQLPKLRSLEFLGQIGGPWSIIPWAQLQLLTHLAVEMEGCADVVNQFSSLISLHLRMLTKYPYTGFTCAFSNLKSLSVSVESGRSGYCTLEPPSFVLANLKCLSLRSFEIETFRGVSDNFLPRAPNIQELVIDYKLVPYPDDADEEVDLEEEGNQEEMEEHEEEEEGKEDHGQEEDGDLEEEEEEDLEDDAREKLEAIAAGCPNLETLTLPLEELEDQKYWQVEDEAERLLPKLVGIFVAVCPKFNTIKANQKDRRFFGLAQRTFPQLTFFFQDDHILNCQICNKAKNCSNM